MNVTYIEAEDSIFCLKIFKIGSKGAVIRAHAGRAKLGPRPHAARLKTINENKASMCI